MLDELADAMVGEDAPIRLTEDSITVARMMAKTGRSERRARKFLDAKVAAGVLRRERRYDVERHCKLFVYFPVCEQVVK